MEEEEKKITIYDDWLAGWLVVEIFEIIVIQKKKKVFFHFSLVAVLNGWKKNNINSCSMVMGGWVNSLIWSDVQFSIQFIWTNNLNRKNHYYYQFNCQLFSPFTNLDYLLHKHKINNRFSDIIIILLFNSMWFLFLVMINIYIVFAIFDLVLLCSNQWTKQNKTKFFLWIN